MDYISLEKVKELASINKPHCISIFMPTHRSGQEVKEMLDQKELKNHVKAIQEKLEKLRLKEAEMEKLLQPINELLEDKEFWTRQNEGLAIFRNHDQFEYYSLPTPFESLNYVADHFYPLPLTTHLNKEGRFYMLALSLGEVKLYEGTAHRIKDLELDELLPESLEEVVGFDIKEKQLQYKSGIDEKGRAKFHGHGVSNQEFDKLEALKYFRAVNDGVMKHLRNKKEPLVLAAVDYLVPIYQEANNYQNLQEKFVPGNPEQAGPEELHEKSLEIVESYFTKNRKEKAKVFEEMLSNKKASYKEEEIIPAAINQRVDTLFVKKGETLWGFYDKESNRIKVREVQTEHTPCLLNMAAMHTLLNGGNVFTVKADEMPEPASRLNALYRF